MAGGNLFGRVLSYVVNEFLVEGLANNRAFQRFAVKTNKTLENLSSKLKKRGKSYQSNGGMLVAMMIISGGEAGLHISRRP